jgi:hypothetical protein
MGIIKDETFDSVTAPALPSGWSFDARFTTSGSLGVGESPTSSPNLLLLTPTTATTTAFGCWQTLDGNNGDVIVQSNINVVAVASSVSQVGVFARSDTTSPAISPGHSFYLGRLDYRAPALTLTAVVNGVSSNIGSVTILDALSEPQWYSILLTCSGTTISLALQYVSGQWLNASGRFQVGQVTAISGTESSISGQGYAGLTAASNTLTDYCLFDDWVLSGGSSPTAFPPQPNVVRLPYQYYREWME